MPDGYREPQLVEDAVVTRAPKIKHVPGFSRDRALCGAEISFQKSGKKPKMPECVVCWDIWVGMTHSQREALWSIYR